MRIISRYVIFSSNCDLPMYRVDISNQWRIITHMVCIEDSSIKSCFAYLILQRVRTEHEDNGTKSLDRQKRCRLYVVAGSVSIFCLLTLPCAVLIMWPLIVT